MSAQTDAAGVPALPPAPRWRALPRPRWALLVGLAFLWALWRAGVLAPHGALLHAGGLPLAGRFLGAALRPELSPDFLRITLGASLTTLAYAVLGTLLSVAAGLALGLLASRGWWRARGGGSRWQRAAWWGARASLVLPRGFHEVIWGLLFLELLGLDPLSAILAIAIPFGAITARVYAEILDETDPRPRDALLAAGAPPLAATLYGLLPAAAPDLVSYGFYRFECGIRAAAVLGIVGAGGLGYELRLSLQSLRYEQVWVLLLALVLLSAAADAWSAAVRRRLARPVHPRMSGPGPAAQAKGDTGKAAAGATRPRPARRDPILRASLATAALLAALSWLYLRPELARLASPRVWERARALAAQAWPPALGGLPPEAYLRATTGTLAMSILAIVFAALFAAPLAVLAARSVTGRGGLADAPGPSRLGRVGARALRAAARLLSRLALLWERAIPAPVWALLLLLLFLPGILPGALALALYTAGIVGRLTAEVLESLDDRPARALRAAGAPAASALAYGLLPAGATRFSLYLFYRWEECIRATVIVGLVGAGGLGILLREQLSSFDFAALTTTLLCLLALSLLADAVSAAARRAIR